MPFTIFFDGLICHIGAPTTPTLKTHAALVFDLPTHKPELIIDSGPPIDLLDGDTITFDIGPGSARTTAKFQRLVPSLTPLLPSGATLRTDVSTPAHIPGDNVIVFLIFPDGDLDAPNASMRPVDFDEENNGPFIKKQCVSDHVLFTSDASGATLNLTNISPTVPGRPFNAAITGGMRIEVRNASSPATRGHFPLYKGLTTASTFVAANEDKGRKCREHVPTPSVPPSRLPPPTRPHSECTNSTFP